jgi:hypothetical protein
LTIFRPSQLPSLIHFSLYESDVRLKSEKIVFFIAISSFPILVYFFDEISSRLLGADCNGTVVFYFLSFLYSFVAKTLLKDPKVLKLFKRTPNA